MKVLFLGYLNSPLVSWLMRIGEEVAVLSELLTHEYLDRCHPEFIVSYRYRYILPEDIIKRYNNKIINLHTSYLPFNRGADPNFWSIIDGTQKGVTIHYIDKGIDTGPIIARRNVEILDSDTLQTSYDKLQKEIQSLFKNIWPLIKDNKVRSFIPREKGTYHNTCDKDRYRSFLESKGNDTTIRELILFAEKYHEKQFS